MLRYQDVSTADNDIRYVPGCGDAALDFSAVAHWSRYVFVAERFRDPAKVLDLGCGTGYGSHLLARYADCVDAVDCSRAAIEYATKEYAAEGLSYHVADATSAQSLATALRDRTYDLIVSFDVIEHVEDYYSYLENAANRLCDAGRLIIGCPNRLQAFNWNREWNPYHVQEFTPLQLRKLLSLFFSDVTLFRQDFADEQKRRLARLSAMPPFPGLRRLARHVLPRQWVRGLKKGCGAMRGTSGFAVSDIEFLEEPGEPALSRAFGLVAACAASKKHGSGWPRGEPGCRWDKSV